MTSSCTCDYLLDRHHDDCPFAPQIVGQTAGTIALARLNQTMASTEKTETVSRPSWDVYFLAIARVVATRATCRRKQVGAILVRDKMILSSGYNGSIRGMPHCLDVGCLLEDGHCVLCVHAESNAILQAAKTGTRVEGATLYVTASPCWPCFMLTANAGVVRVVFGEVYRAEDAGPRRVIEVAAEVGIELVQGGWSA